MSFINRLIREKPSIQEVILPVGYSRIFPKTSRVVYCKHGRGIALSRDADVMVVSKQCDLYRGGMSEVVLYRLLDGNYVEETSFMDEDDSRLSTYGSGLALTALGNMLFIGSPESNHCRKHAGVVRCYVNLGGVWNLRGVIDPPTDIRATSFGSALAVSEDGRRVFVGCPSADNLKGLVLAYDYAEGSYQLSSVIETDVPDIQEFGKTLTCSSDGNRLVIGMSKQNRDDFDRPDGCSGLVMVFQPTNSSWSKCAQLTPGNTDHQLAFGSSVALSGTGHTLLVASPARPGNFKKRGYISVYRDAEGSGHYDFKTKLCVHDLPNQSRFGTSVALAGNTGVLATAISVDGPLPVSVRESIRIYR